MASILQSRKTLSKSQGVILEFLDGEEKGRQVPLLYVKTVLGRKFGDILVRDIKVSGSHAAIEYKGNKFIIKDLGSSNGTFVRDKKVKESEIQLGEEVRIGLTRFRLFSDAELASKLRSTRIAETTRREGGLTELIQQEFQRDKIVSTEATQTLMALPTDIAVAFSVLSGPLKGKTFTFKDSNILIGRQSADMNLQDADVSRKHALIERKETGQVILRDLASRNGTYVNEKKISNVVLSKGDRIRVGQTTLSYQGAVVA